MDVVVKIADRDALPVWTIPYVTEWDIYPDMLLEMLVSPNKHASAFPSAFNLDREGCPHPIASISWIDTKTSISDLEDELEEMEISERERRDRWRMEAIKIIMKTGYCYIWLDEFTKWLESRKDCDQEILMKPSDNGQGFTIYHIELSLTPLLLPEHELYFQNTELSKIDKTNLHAKTKPRGNTKDDGEGKRRDRQVSIICTIAATYYPDVLQIPEGGKKAIKVECLKDSSLFTDSGFDHAWKEANKCGLISMKDKEKYL